MLLIAFPENAIGGIVEDAMTSLSWVTKEFPSLIVQSTQGVLIMVLQLLVQLQSKNFKLLVATRPDDVLQHPSG